MGKTGMQTWQGRLAAQANGQVSAASRLRAAQAHHQAPHSRARGARRRADARLAVCDAAGCAHTSTEVVRLHRAAGKGRAALLAGAPGRQQPGTSRHTKMLVRAGTSCGLLSHVCCGCARSIGRWAALGAARAKLFLARDAALAGGVAEGARRWAGSAAVCSTHAQGCLTGSKARL